MAEKNKQQKPIVLQLVVRPISYYIMQMFAHGLPKGWPTSKGRKVAQA